MKIRTVASGVTVIILIVCAPCTSVAQQTKERLIRRLPVEQSEPIAITDIKVNDQSVLFDEKFSADDDWLKNLVVLVKNKSEKLILFASVQLQFPRPAGSHDQMSIDNIFYGNWALQSRSPTSEERARGLAPGQTAQINLSDEQFFALKEFLSGTHYASSIEEVDFRIDRIIFEDDSMWSRGTQQVRDPNDHSRWTSANGGTKQD